MTQPLASFTPEQFQELLTAVRSGKGPAARGLGRPAQASKVFGFGCPGGDDMGGSSVYALLAAGSPRLALARARGVPFAPFMINVRAIFPDTSTSVVPDVGSDVKITQDLLVDCMVFRIQNESTTANSNLFQPQSDFFFGFQSGLEATLDIQGQPRYTIADKFMPISTLADMVNGNSHWPYGWVLNYQQQLFMSFNAKIQLPYAPLEVICSFRTWSPVTQTFTTMSTREACNGLINDFGIDLSDAYVNQVCSL